MIEIFNALFFAFYFRVLGGLFTKPGTDENAVARYVSLPIGFAVLTLQMYDTPVRLAAFCLIFVIARLMPTRPLLDAGKGDKTAIWKGLKRNAWILPEPCPFQAIG